MKKSESKYFNTAFRMDQAFLELLGKKDMEYITVKEICEKEIPEIIQNLEEMKVLREDLWMSEAKPFGYELMDVKLGAVITRLHSASRRVKKYLEGSIPQLEELEEELELSSLESSSVSSVSSSVSSVSTGSPRPVSSSVVTSPPS